MSQSTELVPPSATLGEQAQRTREVWNVRLFSILGIALPQLFAEHRQALFARIAASTTPERAHTFDDESLVALRASLHAAEKLGVKEMPDDPVRMTKELGDVYDTYVAQKDNLAERSVKFFYNPKSVAPLDELAAHFGTSRETVAALAGEYYGHVILASLTQREEAVA